MPFAAIWMYLEIIIVSEVSKTEKSKYHMISHIQNLKKNTNELLYKTEIEKRPRNIKQTQKTNV